MMSWYNPFSWRKHTNHAPIIPDLSEQAQQSPLARLSPSPSVIELPTVYTNFDDIFKE